MKHPAAETVREYSELNSVRNPNPALLVGVFAEGLPKGVGSRELVHVPCVPDSTDRGLRLS